MEAVTKAAFTVLLAAALLVAGGAGLVRTPGSRGEGTLGAADTPPAPGLLRPVAIAGSLEGQIAALQERLRAVPSDWRGYAQLGLAYVAQARVTADPSWYPKSEGALRESLRLKGRDNVEALLGLGALALARHDFRAALVYGRRAVAANPHDADAYGVVGDALLELGRYEAAFEAFQMMVDTRPDLASYARASYARELTGDLDGAASAMRMAFEAAGTPGDGAWAAYRLGELAWNRGAVGEAASWYRRGLELEPAYVPNLAGLAKVAWARGDVDLATERYAAVVERYPSAEFVIALGDLYAATGREDMAEDQYAVVRATAELARANGVNVDLELALFDADHGEAEAALEAARAEWVRRKSVHVADAMAWALYANGRAEEAARYARRALALGGRDPLFLFHAGMIRLALGDRDAARALLREALARNPHFSIQHAPSAERALAELGSGR